MRKTLLLLVSALLSITMVADVKELKLYTTNFQNWDAVSSATNVTTKKVTTRYSQEELTFSFTETEVKPDGTNSKFTSDVNLLFVPSGLTSVSVNEKVNSSWL